MHGTGEGGCFDIDQVSSEFLLAFLRSPGGLYSIPGSPIPPDMPSSPLWMAFLLPPRLHSLVTITSYTHLGCWHPHSIAPKQRLRILSAPSPTSPSYPCLDTYMVNQLKTSPPGISSFINCRQSKSVDALLLINRIK